MFCAPENVSVNCLAQDFSYKPYGRPVFFTVSVPDGGDIRRRNMCRHMIIVNKRALVGEFVRNTLTFIYELQTEAAGRVLNTRRRNNLVVTLRGM
jgi:hypothetical protein